MFESLINKVMGIFKGEVEKKISNIINSKNISVESIPESSEDFIAFRDKIAVTPEGGAAAFLVACIMYNQNPQIGRECIIIQTDASQLQPSNQGYKGFDLTSTNNNLISQLKEKPYIIHSYIQGTHSEKGYVLPSLPYNFLIERTEKTDGGKYVKVFVCSTGADTSRPIRMSKNEKGIWKGIEYSSLFVGVKPPKKEGPVAGDF